MTRDVVFITIECIRHDYREYAPVFDGSGVNGIVAGHYTRPSLASLLSGQYRASVKTRVMSPTIAEVLRQNGYSTMGFSYSPQTSRSFGFDRGFSKYETVNSSSGPLSRGSVWRERLGMNTAIRRVFHYIKPKHPGASFATEIPEDHDVIDEAIEVFDSSESPRFLWVHLMGSHRPYGWEEGLSDRLDRKGADASPNSWFHTISEAEHDEIVRCYTNSLERVGTQAQRLVEHLPDDTLIAVMGDHGDEMGEEGYYFHGGYRRRVVDPIVKVPLRFFGFDVNEEQISLATIPHLVSDELEIEEPSGWMEPSKTHLTIAPWARKATVRYTTPNDILVFKNASIAHVDRKVANRDVQAQLRHLGYQDEF